MKTSRAHRPAVVFLAALLFMLACVAAPAAAAPVYYTFEGTVTGTHGATGLAVGDTVAYVFLVDFALPGSYTEDGTLFLQTDNASYDYFHVEYVSGSAIARPATDPGDTRTYNEGYQSYPAAGGDFSGSSGDFDQNLVQVFSSTLRPEDWTKDTVVAGFDGWWHGQDAYADVSSSLILTDISAVPEPSTLLLLGGGLLGLAGLNRRRRA